MPEPVKILVVDDEEGMRLTLKGILRKRGFDVTVAESGEEAFQMVQKESFRLILMDIKMPGMSGVETFVQMKKFIPETTVIMMTGFAVQEEMRRALREGAYAVVHKPLEIPDVLKLVTESLEGKTLILMVDGMGTQVDSILPELEKKGYRVVRVDELDKCLDLIEERKIQVILFDGEIKQAATLDMIKKAKEIRPDVGFIYFSGHSEEKRLQSAFKEFSLATVQNPSILKNWFRF